LEREDGGSVRENRRFGWVVAFIGVTGFALVVATQNYHALARAGRRVEWATLALGELPVWYFWLAIAPAIIGVTRRFPPVGPHAGRNLFVHGIVALAATLMMLLVVTGARSIVAPELIPRMPFMQAIGRSFIGSFILFLPIYATIVASILVFRFYRDTQQRQVRESQLETALTQARLDTLRAQLHPHFLFNTLHVISALMDDDVPAARRMMRRLSELLRVALEDGSHEVSLADELWLLEQYVEIQRIRFGDRLQVHYDIDDNARRLQLPRLLLQPLVENAIKHGTAGHSECGRVDIRARVEENRLKLRIRDNGRGFVRGKDSVARGVGLSNTQERLHQLYGEEYLLELRNHSEGGVVVDVELPANETPTIA